MKVNKLQCEIEHGETESVTKEYKTTEHSNTELKQLLILGLKKPDLNTVPVFRSKAELAELGLIDVSDNLTSNSNCPNKASGVSIDMKVILAKYTRQPEINRVPLYRTRAELEALGIEESHLLPSGS
ncbi:hypothetical protein ScPMuIL_017957 [Solemya velum]